MKNTAKTFVKLPDFLMHSELYCNINNDAKILYALLLNRSTLSEKTGWKDEHGVYIIFTRENMAKELGCSLRKVSYLVKELRKVKLIKEKRFGLNKPNYIYVQQPILENVSSEKQNNKSAIKTVNTTQTFNLSGHANIASQDKQLLHSIKIEKDLNLYSFIENRFLNTNKMIEKIMEDQKKLKNKLYWNTKNNQKKSALHFDHNQENYYNSQNLVQTL